MHTREQLEAIIPTLKDNVSLAKSLLEKNPNDESLKITLDSQRKTLNEYLQRLENIKVGRPAIGITRKVSLTLSEDNWEWLDEKAEGNRSKFLREIVWNALGNESEWSNYAALGYAIAGAKRIGMNDDKTNDLIKAIYGEFDMKSDRKSTRLNSSHVAISYAVFCLKKKNNTLNY